MSNIYVNIGTIAGDSTQIGFEGQIACEALQHGIDLQVVQYGASRVGGCVRACQLRTDSQTRQGFAATAGGRSGGLRAGQRRGDAYAQSRRGDCPRGSNHPRQCSCVAGRNADTGE